MAIEEIVQLRNRLIPRTTHPRRWPTEMPPADRKLKDLVGEWRFALERGAGYVVIDTLTAHESDDVVCSAGWNAFTLLASAIPQYATGELVYDVEVTMDNSTGGAHGSSHYSRSNSTGGHHTDGTLLPQPPELALLTCISSAASGGETIIVDGRAVRDAVAAEGEELINALKKEHPFDPAPGVPGPRRPILIESEGTLRFNYLRRYIELGYANEGRDVDLNLATAMDRVDAFTSDEGNQTAFLLRRGEALIFDNHRFVHGRRTFTEGAEGVRRLQRAYGMRRS